MAKIHRSARKVIDAAFDRSLKAANYDYRCQFYSAWNSPIGCEVPYVSMLTALAEYIDSYNARYGDSNYSVGHDGVLGEAWKDMLLGFRALLNGEFGRLDGGALDSAICDLYRFAGFEDELLTDTITIAELTQHSWLSIALIEAIGEHSNELHIEPGVTKEVKVDLRINGVVVSLRSFVSHIERAFTREAKLEAGKIILEKFNAIGDHLYAAEKTLKQQLFDAELLTEDEL